jgi:hypothetical protein
MDIVFSLRLYWWTQRGLFHIPSFPRVWHQPSRSHELDLPSVGNLKRLVKEGLRLPTNSAEDSQVAIPDDASLVELFSGIYGTVSVAKPLRILVAGNWTIGADVHSPDFRLRRHGIIETGLLPPLPPIDTVGRFAAYPTYASKTEDWAAAAERCMAAELHGNPATITKESMKSTPSRATKFQDQELGDEPPPYEEFPGSHRLPASNHVHHRVAISK